MCVKTGLTSVYSYCYRSEAIVAECLPGMCASLGLNLGKPNLTTLWLLTCLPSRPQQSTQDNDSHLEMRHAH